MNKFEYLLRLNIEIEGLLRVAECRQSESANKLLIEKSEEFLTTLKAVLEDNKTPTLRNENNSDAADTGGDNTEQSSVTVSLESEIEKTHHAVTGEVNRPDATQSCNATGNNADSTDKMIEDLAIAPAPARGACQENETVLEMDIDVSPDEIMVPPAFIPKEQSADRPDNNPVPAPQHVVRVDEMIQRQSSQDLKRAFTLNDRYKYIREIFDRDPAYFDEVLDHLSQLDTLDEAYDYLLGDISLNHEDETVKEFLSVVFNHFNA